MHKTNLHGPTSVLKSGESSRFEAFALTLLPYTNVQHSFLGITQDRFASLLSPVWIHTKRSFINTSVWGCCLFRWWINDWAYYISLKILCDMRIAFETHCAYVWACLLVWSRIVWLMSFVTRFVHCMRKIWAQCAVLAVLTKRHTNTKQSR